MTTHNPFGTLRNMQQMIDESERMVAHSRELCRQGARTIARTRRALRDEFGKSAIQHERPVRDWIDQE